MESLEQALTDPENQPSQFGTVTLEWHEAELAKLRQKLMRYEHAEAADILHPPQDEQARADFSEGK